MMIRFSIRKSILSLAVCSAMLCANHVAQAQYGNTQPVPQGAFQVCLDSSYCSYNNGGGNSDGTYPGSFTVATGATVTGSASVNYANNNGYTWVSCSSSPASLSFSEETTTDNSWNFTWTPTTVGTYTVYCSADYDGNYYNGNADTGEWTVTVAPPPPPPVQGLLYPKYVVVGVTYAPPGPSSYVQYTGTTSIGSTTTISSSFANDAGFSVSV